MPMMKRRRGPCENCLRSNTPSLASTSTAACPVGCGHPGREPLHSERVDHQSFLHAEPSAQLGPVAARDRHDGLGGIVHHQHQAAPIVGPQLGNAVQVDQV